MIIVANLKCNHTRKSFANYAEILDTKLASDAEILVFAPASAFDERTHRFTQGAQNFYPAKSGSFTGEIGEVMLDEFGIKTVLIGHSERREILGESDDFIAQKFEYACVRGWRVIMCVGESDVVRMNGSSREFVSSQLESIDLNYENLIVAYEPIWAIGTGKSASVSEISDMLDFLRSKTAAPLLYGGSVNVGNVASICALPSCDGVLVGTASWDAENFINLINQIGE